MKTVGLFLLAAGLAMAQSIPAGTMVVVRTTDAIDSRTADPGKTFDASLAEPVTVNGKELAPKGARVLLKIVEVKQSGKLKGSAAVTIAVSSIQAGAQTIPVETEAMTTEGAGKGKSTAKKAGILGGLGAAVGAFGGGGTGAAIGAAAGASAGTAISMMTSGPAVKIPAETRLTFVTR